MTFRAFHGETVYVIEAPAGSAVTRGGGPAGELELLLSERTPGGMSVERRLPAGLVVKAALMGYLGLAVREVRGPGPHPEAGPRPA